MMFGTTVFTYSIACRPK